MSLKKTQFGIRKHRRGKKGYNFYQGHFEDKFEPKKYYGERPIIYRSKLEYRYMINLESNPEVEKWTSEMIVIPYTMTEKIDGKVVTKKHNYHTDFTVHMKSGKIYVVEIKPMAKSPRTKNQIKSDPEIRKNAYKWKAAIEWCKNNGMEFKVITDEHLNKYRRLT